MFPSASTNSASSVASGIAIKATANRRSWQLVHGDGVPVAVGTQHTDLPIGVLHIGRFFVRANANVDNVERGMNWWMLYPLTGLAIGFGLDWVGAIDIVDNRLMFLLLIVLWPLAIPFLVWHGITVLQWKRMNRRRGDQPERRA